MTHNITLRTRLIYLAMAFGFACSLTAQRDVRRPVRQQPAPQVTHTITLLRSAQVPGCDIILGDIARIAPDGLEAQRLRTTVLAPAPRTRIARELTHAEVQQRLGAEGFDLSTLQFQGSHRTMVQALFQRIDGARVRSAAQTVLDAVLEAEGAVDPEVTTELKTKIVAVDIPPGRKSVELYARVRGGQTQASQAVVEVMFEVDGKEWKTIPLSYRLQRFQYVLKPSAPILRGTRLGAHNLVRTVEPATSAIGMYANDFNNIEGMVAKRNLQMGRAIIVSSDVMPPAVIEAGDRVTLVVTTGQVKITSILIARSNAAVGDTVELMNPNSGRIIAATADGPKLAVIEATAPSKQARQPASRRPVTNSPRR